VAPQVFENEPNVMSSFHVALARDLTWRWVVEFYQLSPSDLPILNLAPTELEIELDGGCKEALVWEPTPGGDRHGP